MTKKDHDAEQGAKQRPTDNRTPFERFEEFAKRLIRVSKSELPEKDRSEE